MTMKMGREGSSNVGELMVIKSWQHSKQMLQLIYIQGPSVICAYDLIDKIKLLGTQIMQ
jgi:hypothetical protein